MNYDKIIQIIPAPLGMVAQYDQWDGEDPGACRVACLVLCEDDEGNRYITTAETTGTDSYLTVLPVHGLGNFKGYKYVKPDEMPGV